MFLAAFAQDPLANSIAVIMLLIMIASIIGVSIYFIKGQSDSKLLRWNKWAIPVLSILGLGVAIYLSYIELTKTAAVCGPVGDCNRVQESSYAYLFWVIPIGV